jgi:large subunit ribosomal protein L18
MVLMKNSFERRRNRIRTKLRRINGSRLRLTVYRSNCNISAQIIDDIKSVTVVSASTNESKNRKDGKKGCNREAAQEIGKLIAQRAVSLNINEVYFDRSGYAYNGKVKALAEGARENGLIF